MPSPAMLATVYANDEDVCTECTGDFAVICPSWQKVAAGVDGVFAAGASPTWALTSASVDFEAQGVASGHVVQIKDGTPRGSFKGEGELLAVDSASGHTLTLRRVGAASGSGSPPGPAAGLTAVTFGVNTLYPQIESASFALNRTWNIAPNVPGRSPSDLRDLRDLRDATVFAVLQARYLAETRTERGDFPLKLRAIQQALSDVTARLELRWGAVDSDATPPSNLFSMRIVRG